LIIKVIGKVKALDNLKQYEMSKKKKLAVVMQYSAEKIRDDAKKRAPVDLGLLKGGIHATTKYRKNSIWSNIISQAPWSSVSEFGSRPHTPPFMYIKDWAERHGLDAGAIWNSIREKGTKEHPFMGPSYQKNYKKVIRDVKRVFKDGR
jgi:HK97 gp10 family phage protein